MNDIYKEAFGISIDVVGALLLILWKVLSSKLEVLLEKVESLTSRVTALEAKMEHFWAALGKKAASILHSPHTPELDKLIEAYQRETITWDQMAKLHAMLQEIESDLSVPKADRLAAVILLLAMNSRYGSQAQSIVDKLQPAQ